MRPLIGITCEEFENRQYMYGQGRLYCEAVVRAGGTPILLPIAESAEVQDHYGRLLDGLLLSGGRDVNPLLYGAQLEEHPAPYYVRDGSELRLLRWALESETPILAICRGLQFLNVALGGTLYYDLDRDMPGSLDHRASEKSTDVQHLAHGLIIDPDSKLAGILDRDQILVNSRHHQGVRGLASELTAVGRAEDGLVEAVEHVSHPFAVGVQAHPESILDAEPDWRKLFESFVQSAAG